MRRRNDAIPSFEIPKACIAIQIKSLHSQFYRFQKYKKFLQKNYFLIFWHTEWRPVYVQRCCRRQHSMSASFFTDFIKWSNAWNSVLQLIFSFVLTVATDICKRFSRVFDLYKLVQNILLIFLGFILKQEQCPFRTAYHSILIILRFKLIARKTIEFFKVITNFWYHKFVFPNLCYNKHEW